MKTSNFLNLQPKKPKVVHHSQMDSLQRHANIDIECLDTKSKFDKEWMKIESPKGLYEVGNIWNYWCYL